jgi:hypothetical protein
MATQSRSRKSGDGAPAPKKVRPKKTQPRRALSDGPRATAEAEPGPKASRTPRFNATTIKAMEDAKTGKNVTLYRDEDELFQKLGTYLVSKSPRARSEEPPCIHPS